MLFTPIAPYISLPLVAPATQWGHVLDYVYAVNGFDDSGAMGSNIARRRKWTQGVYVYAREFTASEIEAQGAAHPPLPHGVFIVHTQQDEVEFEFEPDDMGAEDWMIGTRA